MGYTAVRGGLAAIQHAEALADAMSLCSGEPLRLSQISRHLALALARVMAEGGLYDIELAALAIKQAEGDVIEAAFLLRAYRSTLPRLGYSIATGGREMRVYRRISSVYRDIPGGQLLGLTRDYTQRLLNFDLGDASSPPTPFPPRGGGAAIEHDAPCSNSRVTAPEAGRADTAEQRTPPLPSWGRGPEGEGGLPVVIDFLRDEGLLDPAPPAPIDDEPFDVTRTPPTFPIARSGWLQVLARGEAGALLMLAYSSMRGHGGQGHGSLAELRSGELPVRITHPLTGRPATIGWLEASEVHYVSGGYGALQDEERPDYHFGYGLVIGRDERKAIAMGIIDASLRYAKPDDTSPVANQEFVVSHVDSVEASGFVEHLKLPHYVTFQAGQQRARKFRELVEASRG